MVTKLNHGAGRSESRSARTSVGAVRRHPRTNRARAHLYLVAGGSARPFRLRNAQHVCPPTTQVCDRQEVTGWTLLLVLSLATLDYMMWAKVFFPSY
jgi:hypothetical protein